MTCSFVLTVHGSPNHVNIGSFVWTATDLEVKSCSAAACRERWNIDQMEDERRQHDILPDPRNHQGFGV